MTGREDDVCATVLGEEERMQHVHFTWVLPQLCAQQILAVFELQRGKEDGSILTGRMSTAHLFPGLLLGRHSGLFCLCLLNTSLQLYMGKSFFMCDIAQVIFFPGFLFPVSFYGETLIPCAFYTPAGPIACCIKYIHLSLYMVVDVDFGLLLHQHCNSFLKTAECPFLFFGFSSGDPATPAFPTLPLFASWTC